MNPTVTEVTLLVSREIITLETIALEMSTMVTDAMETGSKEADLC